MHTVCQQLQLGNLKTQKCGNGNRNNLKIWRTQASLVAILSPRVSDKPELASTTLDTFINPEPEHAIS